MALDRIDAGRWGRVHGPYWGKAGGGMKKVYIIAGAILVVAIALGVLLPLAAKRQAQKGLSDGFRGMKFDTAVALDGTWKKTPNSEGDPDLLSYEREGDDLAIGAATLASIEYTLYKGKLYKVTALAKVSLGAEALHAYCREKYGTQDSKDDSGQCLWSGNPDVSLNVGYLRGGLGQEYMTMTSKRIQAELDKKKKR
jgi:hypothetical protein